MATHVRIYRPTKTAMQSGQANSKRWVMVFEPTGRSTPDPIMGWSSSADTGRQVTLRFDSKEDAVAYARKHGYTYTVREAKSRNVKPKAYADNFATNRRQVWTH